MFKKIQKYLLIHYPLFWNTKIVPLISVLIPFHILFFSIGYASGKLDFTETQNSYNDKDTDIVVFFSILIAIITIIIWLVYYFKNNGLKSFYPKGTWDVLKEWSMVLVISILLSTLHLSYLKGYDARVKSYYSETEARKRCATICKASIFYGDKYDEPETRDTIINDTSTIIKSKFAKFNGKKYPLESLMNKDIENLSFFDATWDSVTKIKVKMWLVNDQKDSVKRVMRDYFKLVKEHNLKSNIDEKKWFSLVYTAPKFIQNRVIAKREMVFYVDNPNEYAGEPSEYYSEDSQSYCDTVNQYRKTVNNQRYVYNKTYIPAQELEFNYQKIATAYTNPSVSSELVLVGLYFGVALSILMISFRVTSGRSWLIALVGIGIFNILLGIFSAIFSQELLYMFGLLTLCFVLAIYFTVILIRKTKKGISAIVLNALLWLVPAIIPIIYFIVETLLRRASYLEYNYSYGYQYEDPSVKWMRENVEGMFWINLLFVLLVMLLLSSQIKKWKGIAEG